MKIINKIKCYFGMHRYEPLTVTTKLGRLTRFDYLICQCCGAERVKYKC